MDPSSLNDALYGHDPTTRVVAVEPNLAAGAFTLFVRGEDGIVGRRSISFTPWLLCDVERHFERSETTRLMGDGHVWKIDFAEGGWQAYQDARRILWDDHVGLVAPASPARQFLTHSGITLFKGMAFGDLLRMQIDIETSTLNWNAPDARIFMIAMSDSTGRLEVAAGDDERALIEQMVATVALWDPDVIEGHNFFGFDLPYIAARCAACGVSPALGRGGAPMTSGPTRNAAAGQTRPFTPWYIYGRQIIDTYFAVQRFDAPRGQISSYGLKECARVYKIASDNRVYIEGREIAATFRTDPEKVRTYAAQDVDETRALAALVTPTEFYQAQMLPDTYQNIAVIGTGEKIDSLLVRHYLRHNIAIPLQQHSSQTGGGYTEVRRTGVIAPVVKADVESLYPSIMLTQRIQPKSDTLEIFLPLLGELTVRRLQAKAEVKRHAEQSPERAYWDGLQNSFKILINSFYGYIGGPFHFNDYRAADAVTEAGRSMVQKVAARLEATGSSVIEIDTDGVYFQPPPDVTTYEQESRYIDSIGTVLPDGIRLAHDGRYRAMLSLKIKNYVLEEEDGRKILKGSSLRSRADEAYGRKFLEEAIDLLLAGRHEELAGLYRRAQAAIDEGLLGIDAISRRERVTQKMLSSELKRRAADAVKSAGVKEGDIVRLYQRADRSLALASEYAGDEDRDYYAQKLHKFAQRLSEAFPEDEFNRLFPRPLPYAKRPNPNQGAFEF